MKGVGEDGERERERERDRERERETMSWVRGGCGGGEERGMLCDHMHAWASVCL